MNKKLSLFTLLLFCFIGLFAQDKNYRINGTVRTSEGKFKDAYIAVNGVKHYMDSLGNYDVKLSFQEENMLIFGCKGSVQQRIEFNTTVSKERIEDAFYPKEINIVLFDKVEGVDLALMQEPVEKYSYVEDQYDFDNDEAYALNMTSKIQTLKLALEEAKKNGVVSAELAAKAKQDAELQKQIQAKAKIDSEEKQRQDKVRNTQELALKKQEKDSVEAEEEALRKAERARRKKEETERERLALRQAFEQDSINEAERIKEKNEMALKNLEEQKITASKDSILKMVKARAIKEKEDIRIADEKQKLEEIERIKKEKEEQAKNTAQALKDKETEDAKLKTEEMAALKEKLKGTNLDNEKKRLLELAAQEELFKKRQSKFQPVMGIYTNTTSIINGKKAYGYINFGNGIGNQDLTKEEFDAYKEKFKK